MLFLLVSSVVSVNAVNLSEEDDESTHTEVEDHDEDSHEPEELRDDDGRVMLGLDLDAKSLPIGRILSLHVL